MSSSLANFGGALHFNQLSGPHVVDEPIYRNGLWHQGVGANALDVVDDSLFLIADGQPFDVLTGGRSGTVAHIAEAARS